MAEELLEEETAGLDADAEGIEIERRSWKAVPQRSSSKPRPRAIPAWWQCVWSMAGSRTCVGALSPWAAICPGRILVPCRLGAIAEAVLGASNRRS
jgi:hypothetical protein